MTPKIFSKFNLCRDPYVALGMGLGARHHFCVVYLLWSVVSEGRPQTSVAHASADPALAFGSTGVLTVRCGLALVVYSDGEYLVTKRLLEHPWRPV